MKIPNELYPCPSCGKLWVEKSDADFCPRVAFYHPQLGYDLPDTITIHLWHNGQEKTEQTYSFRAKRFGEYLAVYESPTEFAFTIIHLPTSRMIGSRESAEMAFAAAGAMVTQIDQELFNISDAKLATPELKALTHRVLIQFPDPDELDNEDEGH